MSTEESDDESADSRSRPYDPAADHPYPDERLNEILSVLDTD